ncbi:MAG: transporter [Eubacteriales bacterium]|nr:transporter [Eubacteriales bacterium]
MLFKKGMLKFSELSFNGGIGAVIRTLTSVIFSPTILIGLILYGVSTLTWLFALSKTRLNYAYPYTALTFILVMLASYFIFSEPLPVNRIAGVAIICIGVIIASIK